MSWFSRFKSKAALDRAAEEELYAAAYEEVDSGQRRTGLWAKAVAKSGGIEERTKSIYIELLVQKYKDELHLEEEKRREALREFIRQQQQAAEREAGERDKKQNESIHSQNSSPESQQGSETSDKKWKWLCSVCGGPVRINYGTAEQLICKKCACRNA
jgi:hypothetical protein